ncbi:unnamed protein product [Penicillium egyptiacum]|uniref:Uncharacterized protein n=1 Tax=Penicillium egyptiacum TaxID=1303716 RepID=A0A9W4KFN9_9EURO|nr:unnamed protein product [Penicillium egyptiacum]
MDTEYTASNHHLKSYHEKRDTHSPSNSLPLLLTSRRVSLETQSILNQMKKTTYVLDLSILNEQDMFSTWISVPHLTTRLSTLHTDARLFGHILTGNNLKEAREPKGRGVGEKKGGSGNSYEDRVITVKNIVYDFHSAEKNLPSPPRDTEYCDWLDNDAHTSRYNDERTGEMSEDLKYKTRPQWPLYSWTKWLRTMTNMGYITEEYGGLNSFTRESVPSPCWRMEDGRLPLVLRIDWPRCSFRVRPIQWSICTGAFV